MKKERENGIITITKSSDVMYINKAQALIAAQNLFFMNAASGNVTTMTSYPQSNEVEVVVQFDLVNPPIEFRANFSKVEIMSHNYYSPYTKTTSWLRTKRYSFKYE